MHKTDEKGSGYRTLRVDDESYKRIDFLCQKEGVTKLSAILYMTRFFVENGISFLPGKYRHSDSKNDALKQDMANHADRIIRLIKMMEKEYFRSTITRLTTIETETSESVSYLKALSKEFDRGPFSKSEEKYNLTQSGDPVVGSASSDPAVNGCSQAELLERIGELEILEEKARIRMEGAIELLERIISPDHCTMLDEGEFAPRVQKFKRSDIEEIKAYIRQCTSI